MKPLALLAALALCAGIVLWQSIDDTDATARSEAGTRAEAKVGSAPVVRSPPPSTTYVAPPPPPPVLDEPLTRAQAQERERAEAVAARREQLQSRFAAQAVDPGWSSTATRVLSDDLTKHLTAEVRV